jgi:hypothetical protein
MATTDVLITIDARTILARYGKNTSSTSPTPISRDLIHLDVQQSQAISAPGSIDLAIAASPGDDIRWRETTLSMNYEYSGILYDFVIQSGAELISRPQPFTFSRAEPLPNPNDPLNPTTQQVKSYVWQSTVLATGSVTYTFRFMILDNKGAKQGFYTWDPSIIIKD